MPRPTKRSSAFRKRKKKDARLSKKSKMLNRQNLLRSKKDSRPSRSVSLPSSKKSKRRKGSVSSRRSIVRLRRRGNVLPRSRPASRSVLNAKQQKKKSELRKNKNASN